MFLEPGIGLKATFQVLKKLKTFWIVYHHSISPHRDKIVFQKVFRTQLHWVYHFYGTTLGCFVYLKQVQGHFVTCMIWSNITRLTWTDEQNEILKWQVIFKWHVEGRNLMPATELEPLTFWPTRISQFSWPHFLIVALPSSVSTMVWPLHGSHYPLEDCLLGAVTHNNVPAKARSTHSV